MFSVTNVFDIFSDMYNNDVSLSYIMRSLLSIDNGRSFLNIIKSNKPRIEICETLCFMDPIFENIPCKTPRFS